ncbi:hypothetical protein [Paracidovorax oryzae]|uniref:hypothetical protein n=1 Tax=Paracidovorax oryzae TaxID=862720 RepID=UPI000B16E4AC|nr:hypothetical protein [Paracidovorax oryzae]
MAFLLAMWLLHEAATWLELRMVAPARTITPLEQMVHSLLGSCPWQASCCSASRPWRRSSRQGRGAGLALADAFGIAVLARAWGLRRGHRAARHADPSARETAMGAQKNPVQVAKPGLVNFAAATACRGVNHQ